MAKNVPNIFETQGKCKKSDLEERVRSINDDGKDDVAAKKTEILEWTAGLKSNIGCCIL